ncbi:MAG: uncharacterized protein KVP18_003264 [Porospora cf. gigantea A]|uniref:uncharacterized protein n=1 Tax=Porospora cf. gigantea A TaxID=2853593 RepID=UPI0035597137|nr:MAG: hypothetical protein KVP18_003264 [Porospora cf. gigantea A]
MLTFLLVTAFADRFGWFGDDANEMSFVPVEVKPLFTAKVEDYDWFRWRPDRPSVPATQSYGWTSEPPSPKVPCSEAPEAHSPEVPSPKVPCSEAPEAHSPEVPYSAETSADPAANISERSTELITEDSTELDNSTSETTEVPHVVASVVYVDASKVIVNELTGASPTSSNSTTHLLSIHTSLFASQLPSGVERVYVIKPPRGPTVKVFVHHSGSPRLRGTSEMNKSKE